MQKPNLKKMSNSNQRDQNRLTTAPVRQRPKYSDLYKTSNFELPVIRGKNTIGRQPMIASRDVKRSTIRKQQPIKNEHDHHQGHKRPQTSKGSRNCNKHQSEYYQDDGDDLIVTSMHQRIQNFKKNSENITYQHPTRAKNL